MLSVPGRDVERVIKEENDRFYGFLSPLADVWNDMDLQRYVLPIGDANYAFALADFLTDDLGWIAPQVVVTDALREDQQAEILKRRAALRQAPEHNVIFESNASTIRKRLDPRWLSPGDDPYVESFTPSFVIGSFVRPGTGRDASIRASFGELPGVQPRRFGPHLRGVFRGAASHRGPGGRHYGRALRGGKVNEDSRCTGGRGSRSWPTSAMPRGFGSTKTSRACSDSWRVVRTLRLAAATVRMKRWVPRRA